MKEFEYIQKAIEIFYMQDDLLAIISLTKFHGEENIYNTAKKNLKEFTERLKESDDVTIGQDSSTVTLKQIILAFENPDKKGQALIVLQTHREEIIEKIYSKYLLSKRKNYHTDSMENSIKWINIFSLARKLILSFYGSDVLASLASSLHKLANDNQGYIFAFRCLETSINAPSYLLILLMPTEVTSTIEKNKDAFLSKIDRDYISFSKNKTIPKSILQKTFKSEYHYQILYYILCYFKDKNNYEYVYNKIVDVNKDPKIYYIVDKNIYKKFPKKFGSNTISLKLKSVLTNVESIQKKTNTYFKDIEKIKGKALLLQEQKKNKVNVSLKQSIILMKLNLTVAMLQELSKRLTELDPLISKQFNLPNKSVVNANKLPRFIKWKKSLDKFISTLDNKTDSFLYLVYYKLMSTVLNKYDETSKIYDDIYTKTPFDDTSIRIIVEEKSKLIASIQKNPFALMNSICNEQKLDVGTQDVISNFFKNTNSSIVPITQNCIEEFCYIIPSRYIEQQYQEIVKRTSKHPLYPLITIYCEWYKLRAFIKFFENFGKDVCGYYLGIESVKGSDFEILYRDFVYLNYIFSSIYDSLDQATQSMVLKFLSIFSIKPESPNHYIGFKRLAVIDNIIFTSKKFDALELEKYFITKENVKISLKCIRFIRSLTERKDGFSLIESNQDNQVLAYKKNNKTLFKLTVSHDEYNEIEEELKQLQELGQQEAIITLAAIIFIKKYYDSFLIDTDLSEVRFKGFYTNEIFQAFRQVKLKNDPNSSFINLNDNYKALEKLMSDLNKYKAKLGKKKKLTNIENLKIQATDYSIQRCEFYKKYFIGANLQLSRIDLCSLETSISKIQSFLSDKKIVKATTGKSKCKANLKQAITVFSELYYKLAYIDQCYFSQYSITSLRPFKPNDNFIDTMAYYLAKTFVHNEESTLTRYQTPTHPSNMLESFNEEEAKIPLEVANINTSLHKFSYENDRKILGADYDNITGREIIPHNVDNKFYVFLKILAQMCEYYMDAIIDVFGERYEKNDYEKYESFLDKLITDFQIAINTDFKTTRLDKIIKEFEISTRELNIYITFTLKNQKPEDFKRSNLDLSKLDTFILSSLSRLEISSFDTIKFYNSSYKEFSLIDKFSKASAKLNEIYSFMKRNDDFIIVSHSDLLSIYGLKNEKDLADYMRDLTTEEGQILNKILYDSSTISYELNSLKDSIDKYHEYISNNIIVPDYDINSIILPCGLLNYEYEQIITIICQDILENSNHYKGVYNFKWWHLASLFIGAAIDYFYTKSHLAKGIKEIQHILNDKNIPDSQSKIDKIIKVADVHLKKNSKRKSDVRNIYEFLAKDLSDHISKQEQISKNKPNIQFVPLNKRSYSFHSKYNPNNLESNLRRNSQIGPLIEEIDLNHPQVKEISKNLAPLYLLKEDMRNSVAINIVSDFDSHIVQHDNFITNGFIDVCIGKRHLFQINLNPSETFHIIPCRCVTDQEIQRSLLSDISDLISSFKLVSNNLILLPISFNNWHFILLIIDIRHSRLYFFDSYGERQVSWIKEIIKKIPGLQGYNLTTLIDNFQRNNDCGFLVLSFIDQIYMHNNVNMDINKIYKEDVKTNYDSNFLRQYFCSFAGEPFASSKDFLNVFE